MTKQKDSYFKQCIEIAKQETMKKTSYRDTQTNDQIYYVYAWTGHEKYLLLKTTDNELISQIENKTNKWKNGEVTNICICCICTKNDQPVIQTVSLSIEGYGIVLVENIIDLPSSTTKEKYNIITSDLEDFLNLSVDYEWVVFPNIIIACGLFYFTMLMNCYKLLSK